LILEELFLNLEAFTSCLYFYLINSGYCLRKDRATFEFLDRLEGPEVVEFALQFFVYLGPVAVVLVDSGVHLCSSCQVSVVVFEDLRRRGLFGFFLLLLGSIDFQLHGAHVDFRFVVRKA